MNKVYTTVPGLTVHIGGFGFATNDQPAIVPDEVADQIEAEISGFTGRDDPEHPSKKVKERYGRGPSTQLRVERDEAVSKAAAAKTEAHAAAGHKGEKK
jgi:hypothetical protein